MAKMHQNAAVRQNGGIFGYGDKRLFFPYGHDTHVYRFLYIFVKPYGGAADGGVAYRPRPSLANIKIRNFSPNGMCVQSFVSFRVRFAPQKRVS